jgi:pyridoxamine 5'-phosphate oxidase
VVADRHAFGARATTSAPRGWVNSAPGGYIKATYRPVASVTEDWGKDVTRPASTYFRGIGPSEPGVCEVVAGRVERELIAELPTMRVAYPAGELDVDDLAPTWCEQLARWLDDAMRAALPEPNAMVLATADAEGLPSSRTVLAKGLDSRGVVFYTNFTSRKMHDLNATRFAAATFPWLGQHRQVHLRGPVELIGAGQSQIYWRTRSRGAQLGAWASPQSTVVQNRRALDVALEQVARRFADTEQVPLPPHWGGVRIMPVSVEFWQGRPNRLHDRLRYHCGEDGQWIVQRLAP